MVLVSPAIGVSFADWSRRFSQVHLDLGTGDGTYVVRMARQRADFGVVGIDTCLDHLRGAVRHYPANARFVRSDARALPEEFAGRFASVSINFPYGSLLDAIRDEDRALLDQVDRVAGDRASVEIVVNESALAGLDIGFEEGRNMLQQFGQDLSGFRSSVTEMSVDDLRSFPSAWSRKLGYGRQPRALRLTARR